MGICYAKPSPFSSQTPSQSPPNRPQDQDRPQDKGATTTTSKNDERLSTTKPWASPFFPFYTPSPAHSLFSKKSPSRSAASTPRRFFRMPPSPARHIRAALARRQGSVKPNEAAAIPEEGEEEERTGALLDKRFGFGKGFEKNFEMGEEVGRGHFGYTCLAKFRKGEMKGEKVAVKVIPKIKMKMEML